MGSGRSRVECARSSHARFKPEVRNERRVITPLGGVADRRIRPTALPRVGVLLKRPCRASANLQLPLMSIFGQDAANIAESLEEIVAVLSHSSSGYRTGSGSARPSSV